MTQNPTPRDVPALLPCPFCGGEADPNGWRACDLNGDQASGPECEECGTTASSIEAWNTRADRARRPASDAVVVKALEWSEPEKGFTMRHARMAIGIYSTWTHFEAEGVWFWSLRPRLQFSILAEGAGKSEAQVQAAAQADFEQRIRSEIVTSPASSDGEALREAIQEAVDLLLERKAGSPARSAGHNARLVLQAALSTTPPAPDGDADRVVAWQYRCKGDPEGAWLRLSSTRIGIAGDIEAIRPLFARPVPAEGCRVLAWMDPGYTPGQPYDKATSPLVAYRIRGWTPLYARPVPAEDWQPIETAPREGWHEPILTCRMGPPAPWFGDQPVGGYAEPPETAYWNDAAGGDDGCWTPCHRPHDRWEPTHWMPLQPAPTAPKEDDGHGE